MIVKMIDICTKIGSGATPRGGKNAYIDEGISLIRSQNILDFSFSHDGLAFINEEQAKKLNGVTVEEDDILLNITGDSVARSCMVDNNVLPARVNQHVCILRAAEDKVLSSYILYYLQMKKPELLQMASSGATRNALTKAMIEKLELDLPPIVEQKRIVSLIDSIQEKIDTNEKINRNLEDQAQTLFYEEFGKYPVSTNEANKSKLPNGWDYYKLEDLCNHIKPGTNYQPQRVENGVPFLNVRCINSGYIDISDAKHISEEEYKNVHKSWQPEENDLLISRIGTLGLVAVIRYEDLPVAVHYNFINIKADKLPFEYMYFMLKSEGFQRAYHMIKKQSVQEYVTIDEVSGLQIALPKSENIDFEQYRYLYEMIQKNQRENRYLIQIRDSILPKLMTGKLDVSNL